jgi:hypothetical protein
VVRQPVEDRRAAAIVGAGLRPFTEGFATKDLKDAKALLDELVAAPVLAVSDGFVTSGAGADGDSALSPEASIDRDSV